MEQRFPDLPPDRYLLGDPIGRGGMAVVWHCFDEYLGREVAVKVPSDDLTSVELQAFHDEARLTALAAGPGVVRVLDAGPGGGTEGTPYISMEFIDGFTLGHRIDYGGALHVDDAVALAADLADTLAQVHAAGVLHRDLKPDNVLLTRDGRAKLADFGVAESKEHGLGVTGGVAGDGRYIPPDKAQIRRGALTALLRRPGYSERDDVYGLGMIVHEMVAGRRVYGMGSERKALRASAKGRVPRLSTVAPGVPAELDELVAGMTAKNPRDRPGTAVEVRNRMLAIAKTAPHRLVGVAGQMSRATEHERPTSPHSAPPAVEAAPHDRDAPTWPATTRFMSAAAQGLDRPGSRAGSAVGTGGAAGSRASPSREQSAQRDSSRHRPHGADEGLAR